MRAISGQLHAGAIPRPVNPCRKYTTFIIARLRQARIRILHIFAYANCLST